MVIHHLSTGISSRTVIYNLCLKYMDKWLHTLLYNIEPVEFTSLEELVDKYHKCTGPFTEKVGDYYIF
jgi:hypothetical protein